MPIVPRLLLACLLGAAWLPASHAARIDADADAQADADARHPRICLALSGGGARGYAHLGVLQYLEQLHIPIDCIAGTSMGALIGGLYASGIDADQLQRRLADIDLSDIAFDRNDRARLPQSQREDEYQYPIALAAGLDGGKLKLASGLVQGNRLLTLLQNWTARYPANIDFAALPIPFRAVATDLGAGTEVVLEQGSLPRAMRASMAVPGLFAPFRIGQRTLVDGGLVANLPVQTARDMGADVIIAVNIASPLQPADTLQSPTAVAQQMLAILIQQNVKAQKSLLGAQDILIEPSLDGVSFTDFARGKDGINAGWEAARQHSGPLLALALPPRQWQQYLARRASNPIALAPGTRIDAIEVNSGTRVPSAHVQQQLGVAPGDRYDGQAINQRLAQLSMDGDFNNVTQELIRQADGRNRLVVDAEDKSWGPQYLLFGLGLSNSFIGGGGYNLQIGHRYPWLNASGLEWRNDAILGNRVASLQSELRQPLGGGTYLAPYVELNRRRVDLYADGAALKASPLNQYRIDTLLGGIDLGVPLGHMGELRLGAGYRYSRYAPTYNELTYPTLSSRQPLARLRLTIDQLDDALFPRRGHYFHGEANRGFGGNDTRYSTIEGRTLWAFGNGADTINVALEGAGSVSADDSSGDLGFSLGGFQHLSAYAKDQFSGNYLLYGRLTYLRDLSRYQIAGLRNPVLGTSFELGNVWQRRAGFGDGPYRQSISLFVGGTSPVGPLYFGTALGQQGVWNIYLQLGRVF